jgi:hypothetical protein
MKQKLRKSLIWAGLSLLVSCAACCAIPIFFGAGVSGLAAGVLAEFSGSGGWWIGGGVALVIAVGAAMLAVHRRRCAEAGRCE